MIPEQADFHHSEALQPRHAACENPELWVQWFQGINHLIGLKCQGRRKFSNGHCDLILLYFYAPVTIVGGIKICPCLPVCLSVCLSVRPSVCPSVRHALRYRVCVFKLLPQFSMDLFETLHIFCGHIEDVHVGFGGARINFDRITAF